MKTKAYAPQWYIEQQDELAQLREEVADLRMAGLAILDSTTQTEKDAALERLATVLTTVYKPTA